MGTFDSSIKSPAESSSQGAESRPNLPDMARLSDTENVSASKLSNSTLLHDLEIAAVPIAAGGVLGGAYGLAAEGIVQAYKIPLSIGLGAFGASGMAADALKIESRYMSTAGQFGGKGLLIGLGVGALAVGAYEVKNYFEK